MSKMEQALILDPPSELHFKPPFTEVSISYMKLTNTTDKSICFKVKTTLPKKCCVRPNGGTIQPKTTITLAVMLEPNVDLETLKKNRLKFMVQSIFAPKGKYNLDALWNNTPADKVMNSKSIQCVFDVPPESSQEKQNETTMQNSELYMAVAAEAEIAVSNDYQEQDTDSSLVASLSATVRQLEMERTELMKQLEEQKDNLINFEKLLQEKDSQSHKDFDRSRLNFQDALLDKEDSDVIIHVGDQRYPAHKVIIKAISPVFRSMLKYDMKEKNEDAINIPDCDPLVFHDFLSVIYTGKLDVISTKNVCELYQLSEKYNVTSLKMVCIDFMKNNLSVDTICDVISLATRYLEETLLSCATEFFIEHTQDILLSVGWQDFVAEHPTAANELFLKSFNKTSRK